MKKAFATLTILTIILTFVCTLSIAQERDEDLREIERKTIEEMREEEQLEKKRLERRERPEGLYEELFAELERQRDEIRALREEIRALREMLEYQYAPRKFRRGRRWRYRPRMWEPERRPFRYERWQPERDEDRRLSDIHQKIREIEAEVKRHPDDTELRMELAHLYLEADKVGAAIEEYNTILEINPDFEQAYRKLEELKRKVPHEFRDEDRPLPYDYEFRERDRPLEDSVGEVISASEEEIKVKIREGDVVTFKVPYKETDDGKKILGDISGIAKSLDKGALVKILWYEEDEHKFIYRIEKAED